MKHNLLLCLILGLNVALISPALATHDVGILPHGPTDLPKKMLGGRHIARGLNCTTCHSNMLKGTIRLNKDKRDVCVDCHGWYDELVKRSASDDPEEVNPHSQHDGELPCKTCHKGHREGDNYCGQCHFYNFKVP